MTPHPLEGPLFSQGPVVIFRWRMAEGWPVEFVTENVAAVFGYAADRFSGGELTYAGMIHPDDLAAVSREVTDHLHDGPDTFQHGDYRIVRADGKERWVQDFTVFERDADGHVHHANGYVVDITPRKAAEVELERRNALGRILNDAMMRLFAADDWTAIVDGVLSSVGKAVAADRVHVFENRLADGKDVWRLCFEWSAPGVDGQTGNPLLAELPLDSPLVRRHAGALAKGRTSQAFFRGMPETERSLAAALGMRAILVVPVFVGEVWWGAIAFVDGHRERAWNTADVRALTAVAGALGVAIRRSRDEQALRDSEGRLLGTVESLQEKIALFDTDDRLVLCNEAFRRHSPATGRAFEEGWTYETLLRADVRLGFVLDALGREEEFIRERLIRHRNPSGSILRILADGTVALVRESRTPDGGTALTLVDVTALQNANDALRAAKTEAETSKVLLEDALESTTEAFALYDAEGRLMVFNAAYRHLYKHSPEMLETGTSFEHIVRERARRGMVPDVAADAIEDWVQWRLQTFFRASGSIERIFPDGTWWKVSEQRTAHGGIAQLATEITAIKAREEALRESEERFRALFEHAMVGAAIVGPDFRYRTVNRALCDVLGYREDELLAMTVLDVTHPEDRETGRRATESLYTGELDILSEEKRYVRRDGRLVWAIVSTSLIRDAAGEPAYTIRHVLDISDRKRAEEAARRLRDQLAHVSRVRTMGEMAAGFGHELNQPLTAIVNYAQGCLRRYRSGAIGTDEFVRIMELVAAQALRAGDIIRQIRRFVYKDEAEIGVVDVNVAIRDAVDFIAGDAASHRVAIHLHLIPGLPAVEVDAVQLQQVILSLLGNAIEAIGDSPAPTGRVDILTAAQLPDHPDQVEVRVVDSGPGIDTIVAKRVFEPFFTTKAYGMGMGLAICRSIVESMGGRLTLEDSTASRTTFRILLKIADKPAV